MVLCEGPSSVNNVRVLVFDCCRTILNKTLIYAIEGFLVLFCLQVSVTFLKTPEPVLCHTFIDSSFISFATALAFNRLFIVGSVNDTNNKYFIPHFKKYNKRINNWCF